jgi:hypothetical protein
MHEAAAPSFADRRRQGGLACTFDPEDDGELHARQGDEETIHLIVASTSAALGSVPR